MIRLQNDRLGRILHDALYERMHRFCEQYTREVIAEPIVQAWLRRLYADDPSLHILVNLDEQYNIIEHAVIEVQIGQDTGIRTVHCYQVQRNKANIDTFTEGIEYIDKLVDAVEAECSIIYVEKHSKALEKKYGYKGVRTVMIKYAHKEKA